jgi:hypothetical protein
MAVRTMTVRIISMDMERVAAPPAATMAIGTSHPASAINRTGRRASMGNGMLAANHAEISGWG